MYRIMLAKSKQANYMSLYQFLTATIDGKVSPVEIETKDALDARIETMLNEGGYSKNDFIVVEVIDYTIDAKDYTDDESEPEPEPDNTEQAGDEVVNNGEG